MVIQSSVNIIKDENWYLSKTGGVVNDPIGNYWYTDKISVKSGYIFSYNGIGEYNLASILEYDSDGNLIQSIQHNSNTDGALEYTVPTNVRYVIFASYRIELIVKLIYPVNAMEQRITAIEDALNAPKEDEDNSSGITALKWLTPIAIKINYCGDLEIDGYNIVNTYNNAITLRTDGGFSVTIGKVKDLRGKKIYVYRNEANKYLMYAMAFSTATTIWATNAVFDITANSINNNWDWIDFDKTSSSKADVITDDMYVAIQIYSNSAWILNEEYQQNIYAFATENEMYVDRVTISDDSEEEQVIQYAENAKNAGIKAHGVSKSSLTGNFNGQLSVTGNTAKFTFGSDVGIKGDAGGSILLGTVADLRGKTIYYKLEKSCDLEFTHVDMNFGTKWGGATYRCIESKIKSAGDYRYFYFDECLTVCPDTVELTDDMKIYIMTYGTTSWVAPTDDQYISYAYYEKIDDSIVLSLKDEEIDRLTELCNTLQSKVESLSEGSGNVLYGKKYVACGDSFTEGDFSGYTDENGLSGRNSPVIYDSEWKCYKTYPWWIAKRNGMTLINEAKCGSIIALDKTYVADPDNVAASLRNPFTYQRYLNIPEDADYITIWFGINDTSNTNLGTIDDTTNETFYGAWNFVLEWLITNRPYAKIGIIITNNAGENYRKAEREVAEKWGIPYLDMMGDKQVPVIFGRESSLGLASKANTLRRSSFIVTSSNGHPNIQAHEYQSTFIEAFLRRL